MSEEQPIYQCVGVCLPDADEAYCIGCGRPWGEPVAPPKPAPEMLPATDDEAPPA